MNAIGGGPDAFWTAFWSVFHEALEHESELPCFVVSKTDGKARLNPGSAIEFAAEVYGVMPEALIAKHGPQDLTEPRALAVWGLRSLGARWSLNAIGRAMGGRDHSDVSYLNRKARALIERSARFRGACEDMRRQFSEETNQ